MGDSIEVCDSLKKDQRHRSRSHSLEQCDRGEGTVEGSRSDIRRSKTTSSSQEHDSTEANHSASEAEVVAQKLELLLWRNKGHARDEHCTSRAQRSLSPSSGRSSRPHLQDKEEPRDESSSVTSTCSHHVSLAGRKIPNSGPPSSLPSHRHYRSETNYSLPHRDRVRPLSTASEGENDSGRRSCDGKSSGNQEGRDEKRVMNSIIVKPRRAGTISANDLRAASTDHCRGSGSHHHRHRSERDYKDNIEKLGKHGSKESSRNGSSPSHHHHAYHSSESTRHDKRNTFHDASLLPRWHSHQSSSFSASLDASRDGSHDESPTNTTRRHHHHQYLDREALSPRGPSADERKSNHHEEEPVATCVGPLDAPSTPSRRRHHMSHITAHGTQEISTTTFPAQHVSWDLHAGKTLTNSSQHDVGSDKKQKNVAILSGSDDGSSRTIDGVHHRSVSWRGEEWNPSALETSLTRQDKPRTPSPYSLGPHFSSSNNSHHGRKREEIGEVGDTSRSGPRNRDYHSGERQHSENSHRIIRGRSHQKYSQGGDSSDCGSWSSSTMYHHRRNGEKESRYAGDDLRSRGSSSSRHHRDRDRHHHDRQDSSHSENHRDKRGRDGGSRRSCQEVTYRHGHHAQADQEKHQQALQDDGVNSSSDHGRYHDKHHTSSQSSHRDSLQNDNGDRCSRRRDRHLHEASDQDGGSHKSSHHGSTYDKSCDRRNHIADTYPDANGSGQYRHGSSRHHHDKQYRKSDKIALYDQGNPVNPGDGTRESGHHHRRSRHDECDSSSGKHRHSASRHQSYGHYDNNNEQETVRKTQHHDSGLSSSSSHSRRVTSDHSRTQQHRSRHNETSESHAHTRHECSPRHKHDSDAVTEGHHQRHDDDTIDMAANRQHRATLSGSASRAQEHHHVPHQKNNVGNRPRETETARDIEDDMKACMRVTARQRGDTDGNSAHFEGLHLACLNGSVAEARRELSGGADKNSPAHGDANGATPLQLACRSGSEHVVRLLLSENTDPCLGDQAGRTPLHYAAKIGYESIVARLLAAGAAVDAVDSAGRTPLHNACDVVEETQSPSQGTASRTATICSGGKHAGDQARNDRVSLARLLINAGADPGAPIRSTPGSPLLSPSPRPSPPPSGPPVRGARVGVEDVLNVAGQSGVARERGTEGGMTPLHLACRAGQGELAGYLIRAGASVNTKDANGLLPGVEFAPAVAANKRRAVRAVLQPARDREAARELRSIVARLVEKMGLNQAHAATLASENKALEARLLQVESRGKEHGPQIAKLEDKVLQQARAINETSSACRSQVSDIWSETRTLRGQLQELMENTPRLEAAVAKLARRVDASDPHIAELEDKLARQARAINESSSARRAEASDFSSETRKLREQLRELVEASPNLEATVARLARRMDTSDLHEAIAGLARRIDVCEGRLEARRGDLGVQVEEAIERTRPLHRDLLCSCSGRIEAVSAKVGALVGGQAAALRRLDDLAVDVSSAERTIKRSEAESSAKLHNQSHELGALVERRVSQFRSEVDVQLARAWQLVGKGAAVDVGEFATVGGAVGSRMGGSAGTGAVTTLTDMVLAVQLRVGELDCEVCKLRGQVGRWEHTIAGTTALQSTTSNGGYPKSMPKTPASALINYLFNMGDSNNDCENYRARHYCSTPTSYAVQKNRQTETVGHKDRDNDKSHHRHHHRHHHTEQKSNGAGICESASSRESGHREGDVERRLNALEAALFDRR